MLKKLIDFGYDVRATSHADAILTHDYSEFLETLEEILLLFRIRDHELIAGGGGRTPFTQRLGKSFENVGWSKHNFVVEKVVDGVRKESTSHEVDHVHFAADGTIVLEIEWNNKTEFFDRDLENFKRLHAEGVFSAAVLITRGGSLNRELFDLVTDYARRRNLSTVQELTTQIEGYDPSRKFVAKLKKSITPPNGNFIGNEDAVDTWAKLFLQSKFAASTTHWEKLEQRIQRGVGNPCPMLLLGIPIEAIERV